MAEERIPTMPQEDISPERIPTMPQEDTAPERIPTMPQGDTAPERIPTMPQGDTAAERIPTMPQGDTAAERIPTMPQGDGTQRIATMPQDSGDGHIATVPQQAAGNTPAYVPAGKNLLLTGTLEFTAPDGEKFEVYGSNVISADSGESQIYGCSAARRPNDPEYVARILTVLMPDGDPVKKKQREKVLDFLERASKNKNSNILPLISHGTVTINGREHYIEIYPLCKGGDLATRARKSKTGKIPYKILCKLVIPGICNALKEIHDAGFVHRDLKPDNLYTYNDKIVLGDFGITCALREDGFAIDRTKTGTLGYYAPELMSQAAIIASDYYSFGQTLWTLYSGEMMYRSILNLYKSYGVEEQRNHINHAMMQNEFLGLDEIPEKESFFEVLIRGLLQYDINERFGYDKVQRWLKEDKSLLKEVKGLESGGELTFSQPFKLFPGKEIWDIASWAKALNENWDEAKQLLFDGTLRDFISRDSFELATLLKQIVRDFGDDKYSQNLGLALFIMNLENNRRISWFGFHFSKISDLSTLMDIKDHGDRPEALMRSGLIKTWYKRQKNASPEILEALDVLYDFFTSDKDPLKQMTALRWMQCFRYVNEAPEFVEPEYPDLDIIVRYHLKKPSNFYCFSSGDTALIDNPYVLGTLCMRGYYEAVTQMLANQNALPVERFDQMLDFMEQNTDGETRQIVRRFYCNYGPHGHLKWFRDNLSMYAFQGEGCKKLRDLTEQQVPDENASLNDQRDVFGRLQSCAAQALTHMEADIFMDKLGLGTLHPEECITSPHLGAMWYYHFLGQPAPVGYLHFIKSKEDA